jgi:hypothetical protein
MCRCSKREMTVDLHPAGFVLRGLGPLLRMWGLSDAYTASFVRPLAK